MTDPKLEQAQGGGDVVAVLHEAMMGRPVLQAEAERAHASAEELLDAARACRDMLRESAKRHRLAGDDGHARHCEVLANAVEAALTTQQGSEA